MAALTIATAAVSSLANQQAPETGVVFGQVLAPNGAVFPGAEIALLGNANNFPTTSSVTGEYTLTLPPGVYSAACRVHGSFVFRRAPFRVTAGAKLVINLYPYPVPPNSDASQAFLSYDYFTGFDSGRNELGLLVQCVTKATKPQYIEYHDVVLSFDVFIVRARKAHYFARSRSIEAWSATIDDGARQKKVRHLKMVLPSKMDDSVVVRYLSNRAEQARATERAQPS